MDLLTREWTRLTTLQTETDGCFDIAIVEGDREVLGRRSELFAVVAVRRDMILTRDESGVPELVKTTVRRRPRDVGYFGDGTSAARSLRDCLEHATGVLVAE